MCILAYLFFVNNMLKIILEHIKTQGEILKTCQQLFYIVFVFVNNKNIRINKIITCYYVMISVLV